MAASTVLAGTGVHGHPASGITAADVAVSDLDNDSLILRLHFTTNHLSRWISPVHDRIRLERSVRRGEPSVKELLMRLRDEERRVFPMMHLIAVRVNPDLDEIAPIARSPIQVEIDERSSPLATVAEFRRLRQSTCSLLRSLPDSAWQRVGTSRLEHDWQIRTLAEVLAEHDLVVLRQIDDTLERSGARLDVGPAARARLDDLLRLVPVSTKNS